MSPESKSLLLPPWILDARLFARVLCAAFFFALTAPPPNAGAAREKTSAGVVVEAVSKGSAVEKAGLQAGDVVLSWSRAASPPANPQAAQGQIESPFDFAELEHDQAQRGLFTLIGQHAGKKARWIIPSGSWEVKVRPVLSKELLSLYQEGHSLVESKKLEEGTARWREAAAKAKQTSNKWLANWFLFRVGETLAGAKNWSEADAAYSEAIEDSDKNGQARTRSYLLREWGQTFLRRNNWDRMEECYRKALAQDQKADPQSADVAHSLTNLAIAAANRGKFDEAEEFFRNSLSIREKLAPGSPDVARGLTNLGSLAFNRDQAAPAEQYFLQALAIWEKLAPDGSDMTTPLNGLGALSARAGKLDAAEEYFRRALAIREKLVPGSMELANALVSLGYLAYELGKGKEAEEYEKRALEIIEKQAPGSAEEESVLGTLSTMCYRRGDLDGSEQYRQRSLVILEKIDPGSITMGDALNDLGAIAIKRSQLAAAEDYMRRALAIYEKVTPGGPKVASGLNNLGIVAWSRGDLAAAEQAYRSAQIIYDKSNPASAEVAGRLNNLGLVAWRRGDLVTAEDYYRRALAIYEKASPDSLELANVLTNLGSLAVDRADPATDKEYELRALAIREKQVPDSFEVAISLHNLGRASEDLGDLKAAQDYELRALAIKQKLGGDSLNVASTLNNLGSVALHLADLKSAQDYYRRALAIEEKLGPNSFDLADTLNAMGDIALQLGDAAGGAEDYRRALAIRARLAPGSAAEAESLHGIGESYRRSHNLTLARDFLCRAVDAIEKQKTKLGGTEESTTSFGAKYVTYYRDCIEALVEQGEAAGAFQMLERSRARSLLAMLAERDLLFSADIPADLALQRKLTDAEYDRTQSAITGSDSAKDSEEIDRQLAHLRELRRKQEEIAVQVRKASPHFASLQYPQPLDLGGVRDALDPGTVLLSYSIGEEKSFLFVVEPAGAKTPGAGLTVLTLSAGEKLLREKVEAFRNVIQRHNASDQQLLNQQAAELYDLLIMPAEGLIAANERILISPDGPLHTLPFGSLMKKERKIKRETRRYLIEWKPIHTVVSATVYAELKKARREAADPSSVRVAAFGDPKYDAAAKTNTSEIRNGELRSMVLRGFGLAPLPSTRTEVESIAKLYAGQIAEYLGEEATEERAKSIGKEVRYIHFAVHGLLDERFPLNSALVFTIRENPVEGQDNGLLQAWEVFEQVHIDADLVTLSACETSLGKEMGGEGLVGLTRAFEYAGARSVLASLWSVSDESTAELMKRFYRYLKAGNSKDEALRAAQMDLIKPVKGNNSVSERAHPFYWAAFQLTGDWK